MKKFLSTILAVVMVLSSMAMVVSAETTGTITVYDANNEIVEGTYTTIDTAAAAAGVNGKIELSAGTFEFNGRQTIQVAGVDLIGAGSDKTFIVPSTSYASASATNKKALVTVAADNVKIEGVTIDGGAYGDTVGSTTDFVVLRINDGVGVELNNIVVEGSKRTLISVGTKDTVATDVDVTATNLVCNANVKSLPKASFIEYFSTYADVCVKKGRLVLEGTNSHVNGFICLDDDYPGEFENNAAGNYTLFRKENDNASAVTATFEHYMASYRAAKENTLSFATYDYEDVFSYDVNLDAIELMTAEADATGSQDDVTSLVELLTAARGAVDSTSDAYTRLTTCINTLNN